jgi:hypothetical protein
MLLGMIVSGIIIPLVYPGIHDFVYPPLAELTYTGEVINDSVFIKVYSSKDSPPINDITVYGLKEGNEVKVGQWDRDILTPSQKIEIEIPLVKSTQKINGNLTKIGGYAVSESIVPITEMVNKDESLLYKLKCNKCKNKDDWSYIRNRLAFNATAIFKQQCEDVPGSPLKKCWDYLDRIEYTVYQWL